MWFLRKVAFAVILLTCHSASQQLKKKLTDNFKKAAETYSYPIPTERLDDNQGNVKSKVIVETIKSISPSEYQTSEGYLGSSIEAGTASGKIPLGTVTFNAFEPDTTKKATTLTFVSTETSAPAKKISNFKYYTGSIGSNSGSSSQKPTNSAQISSTNSPAPVRTTSVEAITTLFPGYQYPSHSSNFPQSPVLGETISSEKPLKIITARGKVGNGRYTLQKIIKKSTKIEPKLSDSKPEETGFNGYYDVGSLNFESKHSASQNGGGMGASYMRSSSPFYNYHVMLD